MQNINQLALTFGTLLSSQRSNAHPQKPLDLIRGNLINATRSDPRCQTRSSRSFSAPALRRAPPGPVDGALVKGVAALASRAQLATRRTLRQVCSWVKSPRSGSFPFEVPPPGPNARTATA